MAITVYNELWSPSNINCNWKPEKLSRYSFLTNLINYNSEGIQIGYEKIKLILLKILILI